MCFDQVRQLLRDDGRGKPGDGVEEGDRSVGLGNIILRFPWLQKDAGDDLPSLIIEGAQAKHCVKDLLQKGEDNVSALLEDDIGDVICAGHLVGWIWLSVMLPARGRRAGYL